MTRTALPISNQKSAIRNPHEAGSVLILVVTILALMLLIGMAYIQTAKTDRLSTAGVTSNIGQVINAEIARISQTLKDDIVDTSGNFLNDGTSREPYDYPFTSTSTNASFDTRSDAWLANTGLDAGGTLWPHISNISGQYVMSDGSLSPSAGPRGGIGNLNTDTNILPGNYVSGTNWTSIPVTTCNADADDDGILDAKFTNSAVVWIDGVRYITAMRIIDLSSLLNINTALAQTSSSGTYNSSTNAPHWLYPSELDINGFFGDINLKAGAAGYPNDLQALLKYRMGLSGTAQLPTPWGGSVPESRYYFWHEGVRYGFGNAAPYNTYVSLGLPDELKLRYRNGLHNPETKGTALDTYLPNFIRETGATNIETAWNSANLPAAMRASIADYLKYEPRHQMTTMSNATIITTKAGSSPARTVQIDLNPAASGAYTPAKCDADVTTIVSQTYTDAAAPTAVPAGTYAAAAEFATQFAMAAHDYRDSDNKVTGVGYGGDISLGFERLPFLAEVYVQRNYLASVSVGAPNDTVTWTQSGIGGYAIEIRNPFNASISLDNVKLLVNGAVFGVGTLKDLAGGLTTLGPKSILVLYRNSTGGTNDNVQSLTVTGASTTVVAITGNPAWPDVDGVVNVELQATMVDSSGTAAGVWNYCRFASYGLPGTHVNSVATGLVVNGAFGYLQNDSQGSGNGLNVMLVLPSEVASTLREPHQGWMDIDKLGDDAKTALVSTNWLPATEQVVWRDDSANVFWYAGEVAQMMIVPLVQSKTFAEAWNHRTKTSDWMLNFDPATPPNYVASETIGNTTSTNLGVPRAAILMDRLTTMSPLTDGVDNDGDGTVDNIEEQVIPGRININTATKDMLLRVLPVPSSIPGTSSSGSPDIREKIVDAIINYRDNSTTAIRANVRVSTNNLKGISSMGELMIAAGATARVRNVLGADGVDNPQIGGTTVDFVPENPTLADNIADDREEQAMVMQWLGQVCTTRSDTFAAYIYIRGYDGGTFDTNHLAEVARVLVIFDRSNITDKNGQPKVVGYVRYK